ncbi:MAG: hypothetical protein KGI25_05285 [Thaumarchaeota archaeon]|nr:hypothetical protein [Nitrososphaerota archaeon]
MSKPHVFHNMRKYEEYKESRFKMASDEICRILDTLDKPTLKEIKRQLEKLDIDMDYCCEHPDVLCTILKIACGRSYVDVIRSASE